MAKFKTQLDNWFLVQLTNPKAMTRVLYKVYDAWLPMFGIHRTFLLENNTWAPSVFVFWLALENNSTLLSKSCLTNFLFSFLMMTQLKTLLSLINKEFVFFLQGEALTEVFTFHLKSLRNLLRGSNWIQWPGWTQMK